MKVDVVVNSMRQQIDPATQNQLTPALTYRPGELLRGQVMLTAGDKLQVRLDNGRLLNALPADDVLLSPGSTVMLRVSGNMDGTLVMQLLTQEPSTAQLLATGQSVDLLLTRMGLRAEPVGRALFAAFEALDVQPQAESMERAMALLAAFPELEPEGAAFLAANRIPGGRPEVDALLRLLGGYRLGDDLQAMAETLIERLQSLRGEPQGDAAQALSALVTELSQQIRSNQAPSQAIITGTAGEGDMALVVDHTEGSPPALPTILTQAGELSASVQTGQAQGEPPSVVVQPQAQAGPIAPQPSNDAAGQGTALSGGTVDISAAQAQPDDAVGAPQGSDRLSPALQLQGLVRLALEGQSNEGVPQALTALANHRMESTAVSLLLDNLLTPPQQMAAQLDSFVALLPQGEREAVRALLGQTMESLRMLAAQPQMPAPAEATQAGLPELIRNVAGFFVSIDAAAQPGEQMAQQAGEQTQRLMELAARLELGAAADRETVQQMNRLTGTSRLIDDINAYAYRQIPVQMNDRMRTVELYIKRDRPGRRRIDPENANILIALDTDNMGHVETQVHVSKRTVRLRFGVEGSDLVEYVGAYLPEFAEAMQAIGYRLGDLRMHVLEQPVTPLTATQSLAQQEPVSHGRLDVRL